MFGREAVKVILLEDLAHEPERIYTEVLDFLGVDTSFRPAFVVYNATPETKPHGLIARFLHRPHAGVPPVVDARDRALHERCRADIDRLASLIGRDLDHWQPPD